MLTRSIAIWFVMLVIAAINGAVRQSILIPRFGEVAGRAVSTVSLSALIIALTWLTIRWIRPVSTRAAWQVGLLWVTLTLAFEFLAGHYLFGHPWADLFADYNVLRGRIWILVLVVTAVAPPLCASARDPITRV